MPGFLGWGKKPTLPSEIVEYDAWTSIEDTRQAIMLAGEIKDAQGGSISLEAQHLNAVRELRRVGNAGLSTVAERALVDSIAARLRKSAGHVQEMRAYARFFHRGHFKQ